MEVFDRLLEGLASDGTGKKTGIIDATYLKAHRTVSSTRAKRGRRPARACDWQI